MCAVCIYMCVQVWQSQMLVLAIHSLVASYVSSTTPFLMHIQIQTHDMTTDHPFMCVAM